MVKQSVRNFTGVVHLPGLAVNCHIIQRRRLKMLFPEPIPPLRSNGWREVGSVWLTDCSLVLVSAMIPAGSHKGDPIDVEVTLPEGSRTTSLRGGYLQECTLWTYDTAHNVVPTTSRPDRLLKGEARGKAKIPENFPG